MCGETQILSCPSHDVRRSMRTLIANARPSRKGSRRTYMKMLIVALALAFLCPVLLSQQTPLPSNALNTLEARQSYALEAYFRQEVERDLCRDPLRVGCPEPMDTVPPEPPSLPIKPDFSVKPGTYSSPQTVTIADRWPGAVIYYTLDGRKPTLASATYTGPLLITSTSIVRAIAIAPCFRQSKVVTAKYKLRKSKALKP